MSTPAPFEDSIKQDLEESGVPISPESFVERVSKGDMVTVRTLIQAGLSVAAVEASTGSSVLFAAVEADSAPMVSLLFGQRANPGAVDKAGCTPLMSAAKAGHLHALQALIEGGAGINTRDPEGRTALMYAAAENRAQAIAILVRLGAKVDLSDKTGMTALMVATKTRQVEAVAMLVSCGAPTTMRNADGLTAREIAVQKLFPELLRVLKQAESDQRSPTVLPGLRSGRSLTAPATRNVRASNGIGGIQWGR
jgi:ankyrin repeat protein